MKFSIIIPAHNAERFIHTAIKSIKDQSFTDYEIIVVCDSCTDNTKKLLKECYNLEAIECNHKRAGLARNEGLNVAKGEYVLFLDSDDTFLHTEALAMLNMALKDSNLDILSFGFIFGLNGYVNTRGNNGNMFCNVWSRAWKREAIGDTRFNDMEIAEDLDFCQQMWDKNIVS